jgi:hypothetical protein
VEPLGDVGRADRAGAGPSLALPSDWLAERGRAADGAARTVPATPEAQEVQE